MLKYKTTLHWILQMTPTTTTKTTRMETIETRIMTKVLIGMGRYHSSEKFSSEESVSADTGRPEIKDKLALHCGKIMPVSHFLELA